MDQVASPFIIWSEKVLFLLLQTWNKKLYVWGFMTFFHSLAHIILFWTSRRWVWLRHWRLISVTRWQTACNDVGMNRAISRVHLWTRAKGTGVDLGVRVYRRSRCYCWCRYLEWQAMCMHKGWPKWPQHWRWARWWRRLRWCRVCRRQRQYWAKRHQQQWQQSNNCALSISYFTTLLLLQRQ